MDNYIKTIINGLKAWVTSGLNRLEASVTKLSGNLDTLGSKITSLTSKVAKAQTTANNAKSAADSAQTTANNAKSAADSAQSTADSAKVAANNAQSTADSAKVAANNAQSTADSAKVAANNAQSTADSAKVAADSAQSTADSAKTTADEAKSAAGNMVKKTGDAMTGELSCPALTLKGKPTTITNGVLRIVTAEGSAPAIWVSPTNESPTDEHDRVLQFVSNGGTRGVVLKGVGTPQNNRDAANKEYVDNAYKESAMLGVYQAASTTMEIPIDVNNLRDEQNVYVLVTWSGLVYDIEKMVDVNGFELTMKNKSVGIVDSLQIGHGDVLRVTKYRTTVSVYVEISLSSIIDSRIAAADSALVTALSEVYEE